MHRTVAVVLTLCSLALIGPACAAAQDATPSAVGGEVIDPSECQVEPRSTDELIGLLYMEDEAGTPVAATPEPRPAVTSVSVPLGAPADAATVAGVTVTTREILACVNAGDFRRGLALYSDKLVLEFRPDPGETSEETRASLEIAPEPVPVEQRARLIAITDVSVMQDGRVGALVVTSDLENPVEPPETVLILFAEEGGRWLADDVVVFTVS